MKLSFTINKKNLLLIFFVAILWTPIKAQCVFGSEYLSDEEQKSKPADEVDADDLPDDLLANFNRIATFFTVHPKFRVYTGAGESGAKTYCECQTTNCASTVFVGKTLLDAYNNGSLVKDGLWGLIAHELGHSLQCKLGISGSLQGVQRELHADFLAGYYLGVKMHFSLTDIRQFAYELSNRGDFQFNDSQHHGTPEERVRFMLMGAALNVLSLDEVSEYGYNTVTNQLGNYNITGFWNSNSNIISSSPIRYNVFYQSGSLVFQCFNAVNGMIMSYPITAIQITPNQYRIIWPSGNPNIANIQQDFLVINNRRIVVMYSTGAVEVWLR